MNEEPLNEFEQAAKDKPRGGVLGELWGFLSTNKKWWMIPIVIMLLLFGVLIALAGTGLAPFIYPLF